MRRAEREVTQLGQMLEIMERCDCCRLGLGDGDSVYIVPLNFGWKETAGKITLFFHGAEAGKKMERLNALPRAGFEMDADDRAFFCYYDGRSFSGAGETTKL